MCAVNECLAPRFSGLHERNNTHPLVRRWGGRYRSAGRHDHRTDAVKQPRSLESSKTFERPARGSSFDEVDDWRHEAARPAAVGALKNLRRLSKWRALEKHRMRQRTLLELLFLVLGIALVISGLAVGSKVPVLAGLGDGIVGLGLGFIVTLLLVLAARPSLDVTVSNDEYDPKIPIRWVHLDVRNTSSGFLGGGEASESTATLVFDESGRRFSPKWEGRRNPLRTQMMPGLAGLEVGVAADESMYEQAKVQSLNPESRGLPPQRLDIAYKFKNCSNCYISVPEHFVGAGRVAQISPLPENAFSEGRHPFTVEIRNRGHIICTKRFVLFNEPGKGPEGLRLEPEPKRHHDWFWPALISTLALGVAEWIVEFLATDIPWSGPVFLGLFVILLIVTLAWATYFWRQKRLIDAVLFFGLALILTPVGDLVRSLLP